MQRVPACRQAAVLVSPLGVPGARAVQPCLPVCLTLSAIEVDMTTLGLFRPVERFSWRREEGRSMPPVADRRSTADGAADGVAEVWASDGQLGWRPFSVRLAMFTVSSNGSWRLLLLIHRRTRPGGGCGPCPSCRALEGGRSEERDTARSCRGSCLLPMAGVNAAYARRGTAGPAGLVPALPYLSQNPGGSGQPPAI